MKTKLSILSGALASAALLAPAGAATTGLGSTALPFGQDLGHAAASERANEPAMMLIADRKKSGGSNKRRNNNNNDNDNNNNDADADPDADAARQVQAARATVTAAQTQAQLNNRLAAINKGIGLLEEGLADATASYDKNQALLDAAQASLERAEERRQYYIESHPNQSAREQLAGWLANNRTLATATSDVARYTKAVVDDIDTISAQERNLKNLTLQKEATAASLAVLDVDTVQEQISGRSMLRRRLADLHKLLEEHRRLERPDTTNLKPDKRKAANNAFAAQQRDLDYRIDIAREDIATLERDFGDDESSEAPAADQFPSNSPAASRTAESADLNDLSFGRADRLTRLAGPDLENAIAGDNAALAAVGSTIAEAQQWLEIYEKQLQGVANEYRKEVALGKDADQKRGGLTDLDSDRGPDKWISAWVQATAASGNDLEVDCVGGVSRGQVRDQILYYGLALDLVEGLHIGVQVNPG